MVGIGAVGFGSSSDILEGLGLSAAERKSFLAGGPVGDICCRYFDAEGKPVLGVVDDRVLAIELDRLQQIPTVIGVATGGKRRPGCWAPSAAGSSTVSSPTRRSPWPSSASPAGPSVGVGVRSSS